MDRKGTFDKHLDSAISYESGSGGADVESITMIRSGQFSTIYAPYSVDSALPILDAIKWISDAGRGTEFKTDIGQNRFGTQETFTSRSFDD